MSVLNVRQKRIAFFDRLVWALLLCGLFLFLSPTGVLANEENNDQWHQKWYDLNEQASEVLALVEKKDYATAKNRVQNMADELMQLRLGKFVQHPEQAHILLETMLQAKDALTETDLDEQKVQKKVLTMKLALNAVAHQEEPLWLQYYPSIEKVILELQHALKEGERDPFFAHLNRLAVHYELVRPAIIVSHPLRVYTQLDSQMAYLTEQRSQLWQDKERTEALLDALLEQVRIAFFLENDSQKSFWFLMVGLGTFICGILSYVGWRKYQGERARQTVSWREFNQS